MVNKKCVTCCAVIFAPLKCILATNQRAEWAGHRFIIISFFLYLFFFLTIYSLLEGKFAKTFITKCCNLVLLLPSSLPRWWSHFEYSPSVRQKKSKTKTFSVIVSILNFDPSVNYGTTVQEHSIAFVFPLHKASENGILVNFDIEFMFIK